MEWSDKIDSFKKIDVRGIQGNFFQGIKKQAMQLPAGNGLEIVQSFDPIPRISPNKRELRSSTHTFIVQK